MFENRLQNRNATTIQFKKSIQMEEVTGLPGLLKILLNENLRRLVG